MLTAPFFLPFSILIDQVIFIRNLWTEPKRDKINSSYFKDGKRDKEEDLTSVLAELVYDTERQLKIEHKTYGKGGKDNDKELLNKNGGYQINIVEFNKKLMKKLNVVDEIQRLIYDHTIPDKFVFNDYT